ncbi:MAG: Hsp20/alpha crystallin family protein [Dehalococcoidia bacterium]
MKQRSADIFSDFERIRERMEQAWQQVLGPPGAHRFGPPVLEPPADVYETDETVVVVAEMAGISEEEVEITVNGRMLTLSGERKPSAGEPGRMYSQLEIGHGPFRRELLLPAEVNADEARAVYSQGMLQIELPKMTRRASRRQLKIVVH